VNRVILELEREGAIRRNGTHVVAVRPELLRRVADRGSDRVDRVNG
jgi:hypothetical protein